MTWADGKSRWIFIRDFYFGPVILMGDITYDSDRLKESYMSPGTHLINSLTSFLVPRTLFSLLKKNKYRLVDGVGQIKITFCLSNFYTHCCIKSHYVINYFLFKNILI